MHQKHRVVRYAPIRDVGEAGRVMPRERVLKGAGVRLPAVGPVADKCAL